MKNRKIQLQTIKINDKIYRDVTKKVLADDGGVYFSAPMNDAARFCGKNDKIKIIR